MSGRLRSTSVRDLAIAAACALVASIVLARTSSRGSDVFFVAVLLGLAIGLAVIAFATRRRHRRGPTI